MKKIFAIIVLMLAVGNTSTLLAGEYLKDAAWLQLRGLHAEYLGRQNDMTYGETEMWIAQDMNKWLKREKNKYVNQIRTQKSENEKLTNRLNKFDNDSSKTIIKQYQSLKDENSNLKDELECCKILNNIAYTVIGIILVLFIAFILIKKCQAKKLPKVIEDAINENM